MSKHAPLYAIALAALFVATPATVRADPDKDESGKGREKRDGKDGKGREDAREWSKDVDEANRELRKAVEERDRELDKARAEAEREGKPEKWYEKRDQIWSKFREKEDKARRKLDEKYAKHGGGAGGRPYERDYEGAWESDRRFGRDREWERDDRRSEVPAGGREEWVKYAQTPRDVQRVLDRERGRSEIRKILVSGDGRREVYRAIIEERGGDRVLIVTGDGRALDDYFAGGRR